MKRLLVTGHKLAGKTTTAEIMQEFFGYKFKDSSMAAAEIFIYDHLKDKYNYKSFEECYKDRRNRRKEWHDLICDYNKDDKAKLAKEILKQADIYVGMRSNAEVEECLKQNLFDLVIGVYDPRKPEEDKDSFNIDIWEKSDIVIPNAGTIEDLRKKITKLAPLFGEGCGCGC